VRQGLPSEELIRRVAASVTFQKSPRLRAFFLYVCQCALEERAEAATEQQIGIHVFGRRPDYSPGEDNIVRSQARLLRWKLEQYFTHEGKDEPLLIVIPKGQYLPVSEERAPATPTAPLQPLPAPAPTFGFPLRPVFVTLGVLLVATALWLAKPLLRSRPLALMATAAALPNDLRSQPSSPPPPTLAVAADGGIRIAAGLSGSGYVDVWGRRWDSDRYYRGGVAAAGPADVFPPVADPGLFRTMRQATSANSHLPLSEAVFAYDIPVPPGVYEMRLYFADPDLRGEVEGQEDSQNMHHMQVLLNGRTLLWNFDPVADGTPGATDIRAFKDVSPAADGMVHLQFIPCPERPFVNAIELIPASAGKINPIRIAARHSAVLESDGTRWRADDFFIHGRTIFYQSPEPTTEFPQYAAGERFGNFSYAIPVPPGSYTVHLYFAESFFIPSNAAGLCSTGKGCRVFDVSCNGQVLLHDFDVYQAAGAGFRTVVRTFHGLHPNGQGKLLLAFSPRVNYAEVRAIEVLDEAE
jgi:hypothetical protein